MTNASCADCGRIIAFRTPDPSEIAECRGCGTWVKRSAEMLGVAVSVKKTGSGPTARKTPLPPRKDHQPESPMNTRRSATKRTALHSKESESSIGKDSLSVGQVYASLRSLEKSVHGLKEGQQRLIQGQERLQKGQTHLHNGYQQLKEGQKILLERTLPVPAMPSPERDQALASESTSARPHQAQAPRSWQDASRDATTPFSSLYIPLVPFGLEDLGVAAEQEVSDDSAVIPETERSSLTSLLEEPLPEPPPLEEVVAPEPEQPELEPVSKAPASTPEPAPEDATTSATAIDPLAPLHDSPFTIEGPPAEPFQIVQDENAAELPENTEPFATAPPAFGATEHQHEPCEITDPFATGLEPTEDEAEEAGEAEDAPADATPLAEDAPDSRDAKSLSQQIAEAKKEQKNVLDPSYPELLTQPEKSRLIPTLGVLFALLGLIAAALFFFTDIFKKPTLAPTPIPTVEIPYHGVPLPDEDPRVAEAEEIAVEFLKAKTQEEVAKVILPIDDKLLADFWEPMTAPTIERLFQGRILSKDRIEVDYLVRDFGREERLLSLVKLGEEPFQVDWQSFAECEEVTLFGLAQGTLILDDDREVTEGAIRSWVQDDQELAERLEMENFQAFRLHNFTEEVEAQAVIRTDAPDFELLRKALSQTEIKHRGKPAIRAVVRVKRIEKEDTEKKKPARLEIVEVISTEWTLSDSYQLKEEKLPEIPSTEPASEQSTAPTEEDTTSDTEGEGEASVGLPPVPAENAPLSKVRQETPLFRTSVD